MPLVPVITMANNAGVVQTVVDRLEALAEAAFAAWGATLAGDATVNVTLAIQPTTPSGRAQGGYQAGVYLATVDGINVFEPGASYQLRTGQEHGQAGADILIEIAQDYLLNELFLDQTPDTANDIPLDRTDGYSVLLHEIGHALGFIGYWVETTASFSFGANTPYDTRLTLREGEAFFDGSNVRAVYGDAVPLTDNNYAHYGNTDAFPGETDDPLTGLMNGVTYFRGWRYSISTLDLAMLADMGLGTIGDDILDVPYMHSFTGGLGDDRYFVHAADDLVHELAGEGTDTVISDARYTLSDHVENLILRGSQGIAGTGNALANALTGNARANRLEGVRGNDSLSGGGGRDTLVGGAGADVLDGGTGNDTLDGGGGVDKASYAASVAAVTVTLASTAAQDTFGAGIDVLIAIENLAGSAFDDRLAGNAADNALIGGGGDDLLTGAAGDDTLSGQDGADTLRGAEGRDLLLGGNAADVLEGGLRKDTLTGGGAGDRFAFDDGETGTIRTQADIVTDFSHADGDKVHVRQIDADTGAGGDQNFTFIGTGAFTGVAGQLHYLQAGGNTFVEGDTDGDGNADFVIRLDGLHTLGAADFVL
jgi:Ca2+-binding RTX toxin-like protein